MAFRGLIPIRTKSIVTSTTTTTVRTNRTRFFSHRPFTTTTPSYQIQSQCPFPPNDILRRSIANVGQQRRQRIRSLSSSSSNNTSGGDGGGEVNEDYFRVFGIERTYSISLPQLKSSYRKLMASNHPDVHYSKHEARGEEEDGESTSNVENGEDLATVVTRGYSILKDPHSRALHLLELVDIPMEDTASGEIVGQEFLIEIMELREQVDSTTTGLESMREENDVRIQETCEAIGAAFDMGNYEDATRLTAVLQYWNRLSEEIDKKEY